MFVDSTIMLRIERAEADVTRAMVSGLVGSRRAPEAFLHPIGRGFAAYVRPGSPMNKIIGAGIDAALDEDAFASVEDAYRQKAEPVRVEFPTLGFPGTGKRLTERGYRLLGFENVLALSLTAVGRRRDHGLRVERVTDATLVTWRDVLVDGAAHSDETGVPADRYTCEAISSVLDDFLLARDFDRYVALVDRVVVGGASMRMSDGVAILTGSATLPSHRRRGVHRALLEKRLEDAQASGAELAIITTAPGTQSQANVMKLGFSLAYARAILVAS